MTTKHDSVCFTYETYVKIGLTYVNIMPVSFTNKMRPVRIYASNDCPFVALFYACFWAVEIEDSCNIQLFRPGDKEKTSLYDSRNCVR